MRRMNYCLGACWLLINLTFCNGSWGQSVADETIDAADTSLATLYITSSPESSFVDIKGRSSTEVTPLTLGLQPGDYQLEIFKEGFEPLSHNFGLMAGQRISAQFILKSYPPPPLTVDSLDLFYIPERPLLDINEADRLGQSFKRMAEMFAIIPMGQGIIARLILSGDYRRQADILIATGAVLSAGSLITGKVLSNRKRRAIEDANRQIGEDNAASQKHNLEIDRQLKDKNDEARQLWELENENHGRVIIDSP